jgi:hypothetical protein
MRHIATVVHHSPSSLATWYRDSSMPAEVIIELAHAYDVDPIEGLRVAKILTDHDIERHLPVCASHMSTLLLAEELHRRAQTQSDPKASTSLR